MITSQVAPGYWLPYAYGSDNKKKHDYLSQISYDFFKSRIKENKNSKSVRYVNVYDINDKESDEYLSEILLPEQKKQLNFRKLILFNNIVACRHFLTIKIDTQIFLK
jgi:hypothetical protein